MRIIGDLHARQQTLAMLDTETGELVEMTLTHEGNNVREFYSTPGARGDRGDRIDAVVCGPDGRAGNRMPGRSSGTDSGGRAPEAETGSARCGLDSEAAGRKSLPSIWLPSKELRDLRALLQHRHQWVGMRTRVENALQAIALANGLRRGPSLWSRTGQQAIASLPLGPHTAYRRSELQALYGKFEAKIEKLNQRVEEQARERPGAYY